MRRTPDVSVIIPVYNGERYLDQAIESILGQSLTDFELLIVNDGSTDASLSIADTYAKLDDRIIVLSQETNRGVVDALNRGSIAASGRIIALLGQDDIALPDRLKEQVKFLNLHSPVTLLGSHVVSINEQGNMITEMLYPETDHQIRLGLTLENQIAAPSAAYRADVVRKYNLSYDACYTGAEDYALWCSLLRFGSAHNLQMPLIKYRVHTTQMSITHEVVQRWRADQISARERSAFDDELPLSTAERLALNWLFALFLRRFKESPVRARNTVIAIGRLQNVPDDQFSEPLADRLRILQRLQRLGTLQRLARRFVNTTGSADKALTYLANSV